MGLDERYRWAINEEAGVKDVTDRPRPVGVGIQDGRVILSAQPGWVSIPPDVAARIGFYLQTAAATIEQQDRRS